MSNLYIFIFLSASEYKKNNYDFYFFTIASSYSTIAPAVFCLHILSRYFPVSALFDFIAILNLTIVT